MSKNKVWKRLDLSNSEISESTGNQEISDNKVSNKELIELTEDISFQKWGIDINKHVPKSRKARIRDLITGYGSQTYRFAVLEEIESSLDVSIT